MKSFYLFLLCTNAVFLTNSCNAINNIKKHETVYFSLDLPDYNKNIEKKKKISAQAETTIHTAKLPILGELSTNISLKSSRTTHKRLNQFVDYVDHVNLLDSDSDVETLRDIAVRTNQFNTIKKAYNKQEVDVEKLKELLNITISKINYKKFLKDGTKKLSDFSPAELLSCFHSISSEYINLIINIDKNDEYKRRKHEIERAFNSRGRLEFIHKFFFIFSYLTILNNFSNDLDSAKLITETKENIKNIYDNVSASKSIFKKKRNIEESCVSTKHTLCVSFSDIIKAEITVIDKNPYIYKNGVTAQISINCSKLFLVKNVMNKVKDGIKEANKSVAETVAELELEETAGIKAKLFYLISSILSKSDAICEFAEQFVEKKLGQKGKFGEFLKNILDILNVVTKELAKDKVTADLPAAASVAKLALQFGKIMHPTSKRNFILNFNLSNPLEKNQEFIDGRTYSYIDKNIGVEVLGINAATLTGKIGMLQDFKREVSIFSNEHSLFPIVRRFFDYAFQSYADNKIISQKDFDDFLDLYNMREKYNNTIKNILNKKNNTHLREQIKNFLSKVPEDIKREVMSSKCKTANTQVKNIACALFMHYVLPAYKQSFK